MKKFLKFLSLMAFALVMVVSLGSCGSSYDFYEDYSSADIDEDSDFKFKAVTVSQVEEFRTNGTPNGFVLLVGNSDYEASITAVNQIYAEAESINYEGIILYLSVTDIISSISKKKDTCEALGISHIDDSNNGIIAVCYKPNGTIYFDSYSGSDYHIYDTELERFKVNDGADFSFIALTDYISEYYPLTSLDDLKK